MLTFKCLVSNITNGWLYISRSSIKHLRYLLICKIIRFSGLSTLCFIIFRIALFCSITLLIFHSCLLCFFCHLILLFSLLPLFCFYHIIFLYCPFSVLSYYFFFIVPFLLFITIFSFSSFLLYVVFIIFWYRIWLLTATFTVIWFIFWLLRNFSCLLLLNLDFLLLRLLDKSPFLASLLLFLLLFVSLVIVGHSTLVWRVAHFVIIIKFEFIFVKFKSKSVKYR